MIQRLVDLIAHLAVQRRGLVLLFFLVLTLGFASQIPHLKVDTSPEALVSEIAGQAQAEALFEENFGRSETQIIVAIEGKDLLSKEALRTQFELHRALLALPLVASVDGITQTHLPSRFSDRVSEQALPPEYKRAQEEQLKKAIEGARAAGKFPSEDSLAAITKGSEIAYPDGARTLSSRLISAEKSPKLGAEAWTDDKYESFVEALRRAEWLRPMLLSTDQTAAALIVHLNKELVHASAREWMLLIWCERLPG